jgi:predicted PurR-regulated permease PerM
MNTENYQRYFLAGIALLLLLAVFLWTTQTIHSPLLVGGLLLFFLFGFREYPLSRRLIVVVSLVLLFYLFIQAQVVIFPFIIAFIVAYIFNPVVGTLERWKVRRTLGTLLLLIVTFGLIVVVGGILIPSLVREIQDLIRRIPTLATQISMFVSSNLPRLLTFLHVDSEQFQQSLLEKFPSGAEQVLSNLLKGISGIGTLLGRVLNIVLVPILTFYILKDYERIRDWMLGFAPKRYRSSVYFYLWRMNRILGGYLRGQIIVCTIVGVLSGAGFAIFNIPFAILLGVMVGLFNVIPFIGFYVSLVVALLAGFFTPEPIIAMIKIGGIFLVVQTLEAYVLSPKIVGESVGLHPVAVIFSILIFSRFLGFWGLIIAVPTSALIKFLIDEWKRREKWRAILAEKTGPPG